MSTLLLLQLLTAINAEIDRALKATQNPDYKVHLGEVCDLIAKARLLLAKERFTP